MAETKRKFLQYRRAGYLNESDHTLQSLLKHALDKRHKVKDRLEELNSVDGTNRFINTHRNQIGMVFGSFVLYTEGMNRALVRMELEKDELRVEQIAPSKIGGHNREFLDSIFYFGCKDDHLVLLQSTSLRADDFENHIAWLFGQAKSLDEVNRVILQGSLPNVTQTKIRRSHVKVLRFGQSFETRPVPIPRSGDAAKQRKRRFKPIGSTFKILKEVLGPQWYNGLDLKDSLEDSRLELILEVRYSYKTSDDGQKLIDNIATSMRHVDKDELEIELKGGGKIRSDELKIIKPVQVKTHGGIVDESDLYPKMHEFLAEKIEDGIINP